MGKISSYIKASSPISGADKLIGTDSANNNETKNFTVQEIADFVGLGPYKVYTALLTQNGGDNVQQIDGGELTIGVTYNIDSYGDGDFTNVGAPNNNVGTKFVATGTTPIWGGSALSYNTGAPVVTVLENTIGNVWFTYDVQGQYKINTDLAIFDVNKTVVITSPFYSNANGIDQFITADFNIYGPDAILIYTKRWTDQNNLNDSLYNTPIEIRVYN